MNVFLKEFDKVVLYLQQYFNPLIPIGNKRSHTLKKINS